MSGSGHRADLGVAGLLAKSGSGFVLPAELTQELTENNTEGGYKNLDLSSKNSLNKREQLYTPKVQHSS